MVVLKEQKNMLWALVLEEGKQYTQIVEHGFHVSMAALEIPPDHDDLKARQHDVVSLTVTNERAEFLLCTLTYKSVFQQYLDLNFSEGEKITFCITGKGTVHLTGYEMEDDTMYDSMFEDESGEEGEELSDDDEVPQLVAGNKRKNSTPAKQPTKKLKWVTPGGGEYSDEDSDDDSVDEDYDSDDMDDDMDESGMMEFDSDDDDEDSDEEDGSEEDMTPVKPVKKNKEKTPKQVKTPKQEQKQTPKQDGKKTPKQEGKKTPKQEVTKTPKQEAKQTPKSSVKNQKAEAKAPETPSNSVGPAGDGSESKKKKKKKKSKNGGESPAPENQATPQQKNVQQQKTPQQQQKTPKKQVLAGGTIMEEIRVGDGHPVKAGKMAHVYYVGKLAKDGKQFDSCTGGKPFRFKVGKSEVIQGWDIGVAGMKVGGKRRLTVPPQQGYGGQRQGPIPPNSTLVFEVELKNVS